MCTGRIDLEHIFRAFSKGVDGVFIGGCRLNECNYVTQGNYHAINLVHFSRKMMEHIGLNPERLRIEFMSSGEGNIFAEVVDDFVRTIKEAGPLGKGEALDESALNFNLQMITKMIPYLRLVEGERLRLKFNSPQEYAAFYAGEEFSPLFRELVADKFALIKIVHLLRQRPHSSEEICATLGLTPSETSRYLNNSAEQGLVRYKDKQWQSA